MWNSREASFIIVWKRSSSGLLSLDMRAKLNKFQILDICLMAFGVAVMYTARKSHLVAPPMNFLTDFFPRSF